ncbi:hypothetical protein C7974DRAFT_411017 [Boeremia exigua]|uniref:uncharacterized protein n=1 Tax=Boeremia exigua TaxID=749465 RepID=UPI001E8E4514|nr:uncharacterized protein C7974DRAFT_411017 [Boeremia exigua]KAH6637543.1 hypothetical protein C7974DRAFT_411017 [Boeremia exigua]
MSQAFRNFKEIRIKTRTVLMAIKWDVDNLCATRGMSFLDMLREAQSEQTAPRPGTPRIFANHQALGNLLAMLQEDMERTKNPASDKLAFIASRAQYVFAMQMVTWIRHSGNTSDTRSYLKADHDFNDLIGTLVQCYEGELVNLIAELDSLLPGMRFEEVFIMKGPDPDIAAVGSLLSTTEARIQDDMLVENYERDHRMRCAFCLEAYTAADPAFELTCGHIVGQTCMSTWLHSSQAQATSCPHCKFVLCPPRQRISISPTPAQIARRDSISILMNVVWNIASGTLQTIQMVYGPLEARGVADSMEDAINTGLALRGVECRVSVRYDENLRKWIATTRSLF